MKRNKIKKRIQDRSYWKEIVENYYDPEKEKHFKSIESEIISKGMIQFYANLNRYATIDEFISANWEKREMNSGKVEFYICRYGTIEG